MPVGCAPRAWNLVVRYAPMAFSVCVVSHSPRDAATFVCDARSNLKLTFVVVKSAFSIAAWPFGPGPARKASPNGIQT